jgi:hypothetical protein
MRIDTVVAVVVEGGAVHSSPLLVMGNLLPSITMGLRPKRMWVVGVGVAGVCHEPTRGHMRGRAARCLPGATRDHLALVLSANDIGEGG